MLIRITDPDDDRVRDYLHLTDVALRRKLDTQRGMYLAESLKVLQRARAARHQMRSLLLTDKWLDSMAELVAAVESEGVPVYVGADAVVQAMTGFHLHRGIIAAMERPQLPPVEQVLYQARRVAILDALVEHTNVGACFRSAAAMGVDAVLVTPTCADPLYRRAIRVSMGTVFQVPWTRIDPWPGGVSQLKAAGYVVAGMTLGEGAITLDELVAQDHERLALVFGTEGHGLDRPAERILDRRVRIPMAGDVDSLNVAAASAVAFYATR